MAELLSVERNVIIDPHDGEVFALVVRTGHDGIEATTAIHRQDFSRRIGGARFVKKASRVEVGRLASTMTKKCLAAMIPADGQKSVIVTGETPLNTPQDHAKILIEHAEFLREYDPGIIIGPDMDNAEPVQDLAARANGLFDYFTGLSEEMGGLAIDTMGITAQGVVAAVAACLGSNIAGQRVSIQGFGAVGKHTARLLAKMGLKVVAVNNKDVLFTNPDGLDVESLYDFHERRGDDRLKEYEGEQKTDDRDSIFSVPADIFVPAARTRVLATGPELDDAREENEKVQDVATFHETTGVKFIVEGANNPLSPETERWLESKGVRVLPDLIVNCGGVIGCWIEWEIRHGKGLRPIENLEEVRKLALDRTYATVKRNVNEILEAKTLSARDVATQIADRNREALRAMRQ